MELNQNDFDQDGMPDYWEIIQGTSTNAPNNNDPVAGGYTKLEEYLAWLALPHAVLQPNQTSVVDLWTLTRGFTNRSPVFSLLGLTNCSGSLVAGHFARITPHTNFSGLSAFSFSLVDADGSTFTQTVNLAFSPMANVSTNLVWRGDGLTNAWDIEQSFNWHDGQITQVTFHE